MPKRLDNGGKFHKQRPTKEICDMIGANLLIFNVQMELLQICRPFFMVFLLQLPLGLHKLKRLVIHVDDCLLPQNIMFPLLTCMHNRIHFLIISGVPSNSIRGCLTMIVH